MSLLNIRDKSFSPAREVEQASRGTNLFDYIGVSCISFLVCVDAPLRCADKTHLRLVWNWLRRRRLGRVTAYWSRRG